MYKNATKCNETIGKWCKTKHGASKIIDTFETYHRSCSRSRAGSGLFARMRSSRSRGLDMGIRVARQRPLALSAGAVADGGDHRIGE
jgi:hypothetical protein